MLHAYSVICIMGNPMPLTNEILPTGENYIHESFIMALSIKFLATSVSMFSIMSYSSTLIIFHHFFCHFGQFITVMYIADYSLLFSTSYIFIF